jgi:Protein kinase domain/AAA ATPase domain
LRSTTLPNSAASRCSASRPNIHCSVGHGSVNLQRLLHPSTTKGADAAARQEGQYIDRYRIEAELGRGGMGVVYRALDEGTSATVALKVLTSTDGRARDLFHREFQTLAKLEHPRVIRVYEYGTTSLGQAYYSMELLSGHDLVELAPLSWPRVCELVRDISTSLALLHAQRLLHRDVNPRNTRVDEAGRAKLLDFGALADFGATGELVGAPSCVAPEALRGEPLDGRADLFALGVVAYWALTRRLPYAVDRLENAEAAWLTPPAAPSSWAPDVPGPLDELILSLLSIDPLARPASAADVIDRVSAIAGLDDAALSSIAESHISSAALVGRTRELSKLGEILERVGDRGHGTMLTVVSDPGGGKTCFLRALVVRAQLSGWMTVELSSRECSSPEHMLSELVQALLRRAPSAVRESKAFRACVLLGLVPGEPGAKGAPSDAHSAQDFEHERTLRMQTTVAQLVAEIAERAPLLVCLDDVDALGVRAAVVLPFLAQAALDHKLLIAVTCVRGAVPQDMEQLSWLGPSVTLAPLDQENVERLVMDTFGEVPHGARLARWLMLASRGNPKQLNAALLHLVHRGSLRYGGGAWILPADLSDQELPPDSSGPSASELSALSETARALLRYLAAHDGALTESDCAELIDDSASTIARLVQQRLIVRTQAGVCLVRSEIGAGVLAQLSTRETSALHRKLAELLLARSPQQAEAIRKEQTAKLSIADLLHGIAIGRHLLLAGEEAAATPLLRHGAIELTIRGEGFQAAAPILREIVEIYRARGRPRHLYAGMMTVLALAGTYTDWRLSVRYGEPMLTALAEASGLSLARRLSGYVGGRAALYLGLTFGLLAYLLAPQRRLANSFKVLFLGLMGIGSGAMGVCSILQDTERAARYLSILAPLRYFPRGHPVRELYEYQISLNDQLNGRYDEALKKSVAALSYVRSEGARHAMPEHGRLQLESGILILLGVLHNYRSAQAALATLEEIERVQTSTSAQTYAAVRTAFHAQRGERASYLLWRGRTDRLAAEQGSTWRSDLQLPRILWSAHALCGDVLALKRDLEQVREAASQVPTLERMRDLLDAAYLCERGMAAEALARHEGVLRAAAEERGLRGLLHRGIYARILRKGGRSPEAVVLCEQAGSSVTKEDELWTTLLFPLRLELPLSLVALSEYARARPLLDALLAAQESHDNPMMHGLSHGARAELALGERDWAEFEIQLDAMRAWFSGTEHPTLFAQCHRLAERARAARAASSPSAALLRPDNDVHSPHELEPDFETEIVR